MQQDERQRGRERGLSEKGSVSERMKAGWFQAEVTVRVGVKHRAV